MAAGLVDDIGVTAFVGAAEFAISLGAAVAVGSVVVAAGDAAANGAGLEEPQPAVNATAAAAVTRLRLCIAVPKLRVLQHVNGRSFGRDRG